MATTIGIISIGDMGAGIARLLIANKYRVVSNVSDRRFVHRELDPWGRHTLTTPPSQRSNPNASQKRRRDLLPSDAAVVAQSDYIFSIMPPRDAKATAERIIAAYISSGRQATDDAPLYFLDLNAIAPSAARSIAS